MKPDGTLILTRADIQSLLSLDECISAVESVFRLHGEGKTAAPGILGIHGGDGGFHIKAGLLEHGSSYFVAKVNANFPQNVQRSSLPAIQGVIVLCDGTNGRPLSIMDSIEITIQRTGAATAVAAKHLSRVDVDTVTLCGCGNQGRIQLRALLRVRTLKRALLHDLDPVQARNLANELSGEIFAEPVPFESLSASLRESGICVTSTPSRKYFLKREDVAAGTFIAAVGADSEEKQELDPDLFVGNKVVVDVLDQCATIGDLHHALEAGVVSRADVHAELGQVVSGRKSGRTSAEEITIFDSTGMALQDAASAVLVYEKALTAGVGTLLKVN